MKRLDSVRVCEDVGHQLRALRVAKGLTQQQLADDLRLRTGKYISRLERGENLTIESLVKYANAFEVDVRDLFDEPKSREVKVGRPRKVPAEQDGSVSLPFRLARRGERWIPLMTIDAAAGAFRESRVVEQRDRVVPVKKRKLTKGMFVTRVRGHSMEPTIPHDAWCLFRAPASERSGIVLVQHHAIHDPDTGGSYVVRRQQRRGRSRLRLVADNPAYPAFEVDAGSDVHVVAEFIEVLTPGS